MSTLGFILLTVIGASFLAAGLVILAAIMASRSTARLADRYPEVYSEEALAVALHQAEALRTQKEGKGNRTQMVVH